MSIATVTAVENELKRFGTDLNLSEDQRTKLKAALQSAHEKMEEIRKSHPDITKADVIEKLRASRETIRERVVGFLRPDQLSKWDAEVAKAKEFLGFKL